VLTVGSASAAVLGRLKPVFLAITVLLLVDGIRRRGFTAQNLLRIVFSGAVLLMPRLLKLGKPQTLTETHSCH
jgi:hypothetical protein